jgi:hypothetical protein
MGVGQVICFVGYPCQRIKPSDVRGWEDRLVWLRVLWFKAPPLIQQIDRPLRSGKRKKVETKLKLKLSCSLCAFVTATANSDSR